jgi:hypothetical protein
MAVTWNRLDVPIERAMLAIAVSYEAPTARIGSTPRKNMLAAQPQTWRGLRWAFL